MVMNTVRFVVLFVVLSVAGSAMAHPTIEHPVTDLANTLTPAEIEDISTLETQHFARTHVQIATLIVPTTAGEPIADYSHAVATAWGGGQAGHDNGILIVLAVNDRHTRIEVGSGLEDRVPDHEATGLLDSARPQFRTQHWGAGLRQIVVALIEKTAPAAVAPAVRAGTPSTPDNGIPWFVIGIVVAGGLIFFWIAFARSEPSYSYTPTPRQPARKRESDNSDPLVAAALIADQDSGYRQPPAVYIPASSTPSYRASPAPSYKSHKSSSPSYESSSSSSSDYSSSSSSSSSDYSGGGGDFGGGGGSSDF